MLGLHGSIVEVLFVVLAFLLSIETSGLMSFLRGVVNLLCCRTAGARDNSVIRIDGLLQVSELMDRDTCQ